MPCPASAAAAAAMSQSPYHLPPPPLGSARVDVNAAGYGAARNLIDLQSTASQPPRRTSLDEFDPMRNADADTDADANGLAPEDLPGPELEPGPDATIPTDSLYSGLSLSLFQVANKYGTLRRPPAHNTTLPPPALPLPPPVAPPATSATTRPGLLPPPPPAATVTPSTPPQRRVRAGAATSTLQDPFSPEPSANLGSARPHTEPPAVLYPSLDAAAWEAAIDADLQPVLRRHGRGRLGRVPSVSDNAINELVHLSCQRLSSQSTLSRASSSYLEEVPPRPPCPAVSGPGPGVADGPEPAMSAAASPPRSLLAEKRRWSGDCRFHLAALVPNAECREVCEAIEAIRAEVDGEAVEEMNPGLVYNPVAGRPFTLPNTMVVSVRFGRYLCEVAPASPGSIVAAGLAASFHKIPCDPNTTDVTDLLTSAVPWDAFPPDDNTLCLNDFFLRIHGRDEFLRPSCTLAQHAYFQDCNRQQWPILLVLDHRKDLHPERLKRTGRDIEEPFILPQKPNCKELSRDELQLLLGIFEKEKKLFVDTLRSADTTPCPSDCVRLVQSVKALCASMDRLTSLDVLSCLQRLEGCMVRGADPSTPDDAQAILSRLEAGVLALVRLYCTLYQLPFTLEAPNDPGFIEKTYESSRERHQTVSFYVGGLHRISSHKMQGFDQVKVRAALTYAGRLLAGSREAVTEGKPVRSAATIVRSPVSGGPAPSVAVFWDEWLLFEELQVAQLPLETVLHLTLIGVRKASASNSASSSPTLAYADIRQTLGWAMLPLFQADHKYRQGVQLMPLWPPTMPLPAAGVCPQNLDPEAPFVEVALPELKEELHFPERLIADYEDIRMGSLNELSEGEKGTILQILDSDEASTGNLNATQRRQLWDVRHCLLDRADALVKVLLAAPPGCPPPVDVYSLVSLWRVPEPELALQLLGPEICDLEIRRKAVQWLRCLNPDELSLYMPQLVQVYKYDLYINWSGLFSLLLEYSLKNMNFANSLFWHLKECQRSSLYARRIQILFTALLRCCGSAMKAVWRSQETMLTLLATAASAVRATSPGEGRDARLQAELAKVYDWMNGEGADLCPVRIPFNLGLVGTQLCVRDCSYFNSFTCPLRLVFSPPDEDASNINIMFKAGDDLRQDGLMLQLTAVMDRLWLQAGLDLRMVLFRILSASGKQGFIELVSESTTLRKIQGSKGMTGAFRDSVIQSWLQRHNPSQLEYKLAVANFLASCAGCCVATYVLGVGDRHNDNIMICKGGHMVHIDFAKILGDAQTFAGIKRDRVPFVFTPEMARVLQDAEPENGRNGFQRFIDLCCRALNILRARADLLLGLARLLLPARIPGLRPEGVAHMRRALLLDQSDLEVTSQFTRLIEKSLGSMSTTLNFFIHGLAVSKHSANDEGTLLSFMPKNYSIRTDGKISKVIIRSVQKCYTPEREYRFIISVFRRGWVEPWSLIRYYSQFEEFHHRLKQRYPLALIPSLTDGVGTNLPGRSHVREVAERRKEALQVFIDALLDMAAEISESDTVYTFFHSTLQDETDFDKIEQEKLKESLRNRSASVPGGDSTSGEIELRVQYEADQLNLLVMHAKQLRGGVGEPPDTYVKVYLLSQENKTSKQKTRVVRRNFNPSYNQLVEYRIAPASLDRWTIEVSVWECGVVRSNHLGSVRLPLKQLLTQKDTSRWYLLG